MNIKLYTAYFLFPVHIGSLAFVTLHRVSLWHAMHDVNVFIAYFLFPVHMGSYALVTLYRVSLWYSLRVFSFLFTLVLTNEFCVALWRIRSRVVFGLYKKLLPTMPLVVVVVWIRFEVEVEIKSSGITHYTCNRFHWNNKAFLFCLNRRCYRHC